MAVQKTPVDKRYPATAMPDPDWWQALWPDPAGVLHQLGFAAGMTAVDLCCGDGLFTAPMSTLLDGRVYAVDLDPEMLALAQRTCNGSGAPPCHWIEGDARDMVRLIPEKVDIVLIANTFHGVPEQRQMARSVCEVLLPGGAFIVVNWHVLPREETTILNKPRGPRTDMRMSPDDVGKVVEPAGLPFEQTVELPPYHYGAVFRKSSER
jgi:SAM-dependent methyltransferase